MLNPLDSETLKAWYPPSIIYGSSSTVQNPDLRLVLVDDYGDVLVTQISDGQLREGARMIYIAGRGVFEVTTAVRRESLAGNYVYLRLRARNPWTAMAA